MDALIDGYDAALFDLDGVIYLGPHAVKAAPGAIEELRRRGVGVLFVTNNAARPAQAVADQLNHIGVAAGVDDVLTSAQVAVAGLRAELPPGAKVIVGGSTHLARLLAEAGFDIVDSADQHPAAAVQGYDPDLRWRSLDEITLAVQSGATWYATNADASRPTDRGLVPGVGGAISVVATAIGGAPTVFGKPHRPMLDLAVQRTGAQRPIFVGDRLDTDIAGATAAGMDSLLVLSGAHGKRELATAGADLHPSCIGADVSALLRPRRVARLAADSANCGDQLVTVKGRAAHFASRPGTVEQQLDALWALVQVAWRDPGLHIDDALSALDLLP